MSVDQCLPHNGTLRTDANEFITKRLGPFVTAHRPFGATAIMLQRTKINFRRGQNVAKSEHIWIFSNGFFVEFVCSLEARLRLIQSARVPLYVAEVSASAC